MASIDGMFALVKRSMSSSFMAVETAVFSFWSPSLGETSTILTKLFGLVKAEDEYEDVVAVRMRFKLDVYFVSSASLEEDAIDFSEIILGPRVCI